MVGAALKATSGWLEDGNGTDDYEFAALPGGWRHDVDGVFLDIGYQGNWWTSTEETSERAYCWGLGYDYDDMESDTEPKSDGQSVRCIKSSSTSINQSIDNPFQIYPNPSFGFVNIVLNENLQAKVEIYTITGTLVQEESVHRSTNCLNLIGLSKGVYMVKIHNRLFVKTEKLVLK